MWSRRLLLVLFGLLLALAAGELALRIVPFERLKYEVRYGHFSGNLVSRFLEYDPDLTFRNRRDAEFPDAGVRINSLGLRGREVTTSKKPGTIRVLCLGDSCTFGGARPYPRFLQRDLDRRFGRGRFEVLNGGVIGYTSLHGLEWYRRELHELDPDIVTIYYGWNDLWREKDSAIRDWFRSRVRGEDVAVRSRLWDATLRFAGFLENRLDPANVPIQIPPARYREVLEAFVALGREDGFRPILVTAPDGFDDGVTPQWLIDKGFVAPGDSAPELRRRYNRILVDVARENGVPVADCASRLRGAGGREKLFERPDEDPIHPNELGYRMISAVLTDVVTAVVRNDESR